MKYVKTIVVLTLLIGFPLVSYYYLNQGFNFRKDALESLKPKGAFSEICKDIRVGNGVTALITVDGQNTSIDVNKYLSNVREEFKKEQSFFIYTVPNANDKMTLEEQENDSHQEANCNLDSKKMVLVDTAGMVRNYYAYTEQGFIDLMEDIAIVLPRKIQKDIIEKNYEAQ